jgi:nucleoside-diphosphate-sugar epimerase
MKKPIKIIITGASGFIGGSLCDIYHKNGINILGLTIDTPNCSIYQFPYKIIEYKPNVITKLIKEFNPEIIIHAAGSSSVQLSLSEPNLNFSSQVILLNNLLEGVRISNSNLKVIFLSSAAVYGNPNELPIKEETILKPISPYGYDKLICEILLEKYSNNFKIPATIVRLFSVFGEKQKRLLIWEIYKQIKLGNIIELRGSGNESRDYLHIEDIANSLLHIILKDNCHFNVYNLANGEEIFIKDIVRNILNILDINIPVLFKGEVIEGDPLNWCADISRYKLLSGANNDFSFTERLRQLINSWENEDFIRLRNK